MSPSSRPSQQWQDDPTRFFTAVAQALRDSGAIGADHPLATLAAAPLGGHDEYVERMIDGLEQLDRPLVLVIDDLHPRRRDPCGLTTVELLRGRRLGGLEHVDVDDLLTGDGLDLDLQALATMNVGIAETWSLKIPEARIHLERGLELGRRAGRPYIEVSCLSNLGFVENIQHDLVRAEERFREAIGVGDRLGWTTQETAGVAYMGLGQVLVDRGRMSEGGEWLARADPLLSEGSEAAAHLALRHAQGMVAISSGR